MSGSTLSPDPADSNNGVIMPEFAQAAGILWFLPTHGGGRYLGTETGAQHVSIRMAT
jgi:hypothetical protein